MTTSPIRHKDRARELRASLPELAAAFSYALDAAETRENGHAVRVAYVATSIADHLHLDAAMLRALLFAGLLHDVGVPAAAATLAHAPEVDEGVLFRAAPLNGAYPPGVPEPSRAAAAEALHQHATGVDFLRQPWFPEETLAAVQSHHEDWDGSGFPEQIRGEQIPLLGRVLRAADLFECVVGGEKNPLSARAGVAAAVGGWSSCQIQPEIATALLSLASEDDFWLGFYDEELGGTLLAEMPTSSDLSSAKLLQAFSEVAAAMVDAKAGHQTGRAMRVAALVGSLAEAIDLPPDRARLLVQASLWADVGSLGVPSRILVKPDLLSLEEMHRMRSHPNVSGAIIARIPALSEAAPWVAAHHERLDGKGYPEMWSGADIPTEARILSVTDAYGAMTSTRPYRAALTSEDAVKVLQASAGTQWDPFLVRVFCTLVGEEEGEALESA